MVRYGGYSFLESNENRQMVLNIFVAFLENPQWVKISSGEVAGKSLNAPAVWPSYVVTGAIACRHA